MLGRGWKQDWTTIVRGAIDKAADCKNFTELAGALNVDRRSLQYHCSKFVTVHDGERTFDAFKRVAMSGSLPDDLVVPTTMPECGTGHCHWCGKKVEDRSKLYCGTTCGQEYLKSKREERPSWTAWNEHFFDELTPDAAYILGFIVADGHITDAITGRGTRKYVIALHQKDPQILEHIADVLEFEGEIDKYGSRFGLRLGSKHAWEVLTDKYEIPAGGRKSHNACIPKRLLEDKTCLPHFIRGLFDGDGYVDKKLAHFGLSSGSEKLIEDFASVLVHKVGLPLREKSWEKGSYEKVDGTQSGCWFIRWSSVMDCMAFARYIYGPPLDVYGSDLYLRRKKERFMRFFVPWRDEDWLRERYVLAGRSLRSIATESKAKPKDIGTWVGKYGLREERARHWNLELGL